MPQIFEVTTIIDSIQKYDIFKAKKYKTANGSDGVEFNDFKGDKGTIRLSGLGTSAYYIYFLTSLDESIKKYPAQLLTKQNGERFTGAEIIAPNTLRLIYDAFPDSCPMPILRVYPVEGEIYLYDYSPKTAQISLEKITAHQENGGGLDMQFVGLNVFLNFKPSEEQYEQYYGRNLRKSS